MDPKYAAGGSTPISKTGRVKPLLMVGAPQGPDERYLPPKNKAMGPLVKNGILPLIF